MSATGAFALVLAGAIAIYVVITGRAEAFWQALLLGETIPTKQGTTNPPQTELPPESPVTPTARQSQWHIQYQTP